MANRLSVDMPAHTAVSASTAFGLPSGAMSSTAVVHHGWVLKKRRKKMQGFARRYFTLYQSGVLAYSFEPGQPIRDHIDLHRAAISSTPGRKDITLDSNTATFHIKCLSTEDFNQWMLAFRKFISGPEHRRSMSARMSSARQGALNLSRSGALVEEIGSTIAELEEALHALNFKADAAMKKSNSVKSNNGKQHHANGVFGLFKSKSGNSLEPGEQDAPRTSIDPNAPSSQHVFTVLATLKNQHSALSKIITSANTLDTALPKTHEEDEERASSPRDTEHWVVPHGRNKRLSSSTTASSSMEWFDAPDEMDGAEEFILETQAAGHDSRPSQITTGSSGESLETPREEDEDAARSSMDTDIEDAPEAAKGQTAVVHRTQLPSPVVGDEGSLFSVLKKSVGKDLSTIALPVTFNEPLTLLQRAAEELEYHNLLDEAVKATDAADRMSFIAAFAVSGYANTRHRSGRKGFNPMLAETFEDVRCKFIAEKVRHQPLEMAFHAEGEGWELYGLNAGKTKFWGKSLEIIPIGSSHLKIGEDHYEWKKPSSFMRNLVVGTKYLEHVGELVIENHRDGSRCVLEFKQAGYWGGGNVVAGTVYSPQGKVLCKLEGKWDDQLAQTHDESNFRVLWRIIPHPKNTHEYYGFTAFAMTLNELTDDIRGQLPPTDSRWRPDVRALEEGNLDEAEAEKVRVEEAQRDRDGAGQKFRRGGSRRPPTASGCIPGSTGRRAPAGGRARTSSRCGEGLGYHSRLQSAGICTLLHANMYLFRGDILDNRTRCSRDRVPNVRLGAVS
ncbi:Oxysterol-binding protein-domain-containing protein [Schizophyllum amplum]|uniref:Oxysterol-binding protein-domain-containing protein n=1 Tax=Schizophyllum amplum TaxID=97359 RepID=A0A550C9K9_9AGAR|nr:Oxysterol-binding protein-domain-containing protein [Auriculariopsis ampla]